MKLADLAVDGRTLTPDEFRKRHGDVFLLGTSGALKVPKRFEETRSAPASPAPVDGKSAVDWLILPVRKRERSLSLNRITVGRTANNDVPVEDPSVSRLHSFFELSASGWTLRDAGSRLGTHINGTQIGTSPTPLRSGDEVRFGDVPFTFMDVDAIIYFVDRMSPRTA